MANGYQGTKEEWDLITAPLKRLDGTLVSFANKYNLELVKNHKNSPGRHFRWGCPVSRLIEIYGHGGGKYERWNFGVIAYEDRPEGRYWKKSTVKKSISIEELEKELPKLIYQAYDLVTSWTREDLELTD